MSESSPDVIYNFNDAGMFGLDLFVSKDDDEERMLYLQTCDGSRFRDTICIDTMGMSIVIDSYMDRIIGVDLV